MWRLRLPGRATIAVNLGKRVGKRGGAAFALLSLVVFAWARWRFPVCDPAPFVCADGRLLPRRGPRCDGGCTDAVGLPWEPPNATVAAGRLYTLVLWNAPMHSWSGVASEAVDFVVPLKLGPLPNLALVGPSEHDYLAEMPLRDADPLGRARAVGNIVTTNATTLCRRFPGWSPLKSLPPNGTLAAAHRISAVYVTQYDPGTYAADLVRYCGSAFDYRVGRVMFETTGIPRGWREHVEVMDELWVPSRWGLSRFVAAGVPASKLAVVPEAVDTMAFDPATVKPLYKIMRGANEYFSFLSVFKWEERKNFRTLIAAFLLEFKSADKAKLFIRSGDQHVVDKFIQDAVKELGVTDHAPVVWVHHQPAERYPKLFKMADAFVLPTHGEGWGRPVMEAMAMELPCVVTYWSGLTDLVDEATAILLKPTRMVPAYLNQPELLNFDDQGSHHWADVSVQSLRKALRYVWRPAHRATIRAIGKRARKRVLKQFSRETVAERVMHRLRAIQHKLSDEQSVAAADKRAL